MDPAQEKLIHGFKFKQWLKLSHSLEVLQTSTYFARDNQSGLVQVAAMNLPASSKSARDPFDSSSVVSMQQQDTTYYFWTPGLKPQREKSRQ